MDDIAHGCGVANDELEDATKVADEDNEGKKRSPEKGVRGYFTEDVAGEDAHFLLLKKLVQVYRGVGQIAA
jgi:hypothetical protein